MHKTLFPSLTPLRLLCIFLTIPFFVVALVLLFIIETTPITQNSWNITHNDIQNILKTVSDSKVKEQKTLKLSENDLNITLSYLLKHYVHSTSQITVEPRQLDFKIAILNNHFLKKFVNFSFKLTKKNGYPVINQLKIGKINLADKYAGLIIEKIIQYSPLKEYYILAAQHTKDIHISNDRFLTLTYVTPTNSSLKDKLSHNKNIQPVLFYQQQITRIIAEHDPKLRLSLAELFQPLFKQAHLRSTTETAISENRFVLIAISTYVNKKEIQAYIPFDISPATHREYPAVLYKRADMASHFTASAVLAATGAESFGQMIGQQKELSDAQSGSGFSFIDLAGDRAGLKFGKTAISSPENARKLQRIVSAITDYRSLMPEVSDLPEHMSDMVFRSKFTSVNSAKYKAMLKEIDRRISNLPIYQ